MSELITVKAKNNDGRIAFWENHPSHPQGQAWVSGNGRVVRVANTVQVQAAINAGKLVLVAESKAKTTEPPFEGYDDMNMAEILEMMAALTVEELAALKKYEAVNKNRKGITEA